MLGPCLSPHVADHPLRPATRQSLGKPLPYQQADRNKADLFPPELYSCENYGTLANLSAGYFPEKGTFLAITHPFATLLQAYDLHVLGTPPAFVLSQDQTLKNETQYPNQSGSG